jgi:uncharacterized protein (TIGR03435 family)
MKTLGRTIVALCVLLLFKINAFAIADKDGPKIGDVPPPFTLSKTMQGPPSEEIGWDKLKGKVVVLEFWATWCAPCVKAIPHLNDLVGQFKGKPVVFLSVTSENEDVVKLFLKTHPIKSWIGLDDYETLKKAFHVQGIPHAVIVNAEGRIAAITHPTQLEARHLEEVLTGKKCSLPEPQVYTVARDETSEVVSSQEPALFEISIRQHKLPENFRGPICMWHGDSNNCGFEGKIATVESALNVIFDKTSSRTFIKCQLPDGFYDFKLKAPSGRTIELQNQFIDALHTSFGLEVKRTTQEMDVFLVTQINTNVPGLRKVESPGGGGGTLGGFQLNGTKMETIAEFLEMALGKPVFDETGLKGFFNVDMKWKLSEAEQLKMLDKRVRRAAEASSTGDWISTLPEELREGKALEEAKRLKAELAKPESQQFRPDPNAVIEAARTRLGLQLTPVQRPVEILEVRKASVHND